MVVWHKISDDVRELNLPRSGLQNLDVAGKKVCLVLFKDDLYACASTCPHAGGILAEGYVDALGNIVCPVHKYKFSLMQGRNTSGEGYYLKTYPIERRDDGIYVGIADSGILNRVK